MSELLDTTGDGRAAAIARAAELLQDSELVILPTDTVYGIAGDAFDLDATAALLTAKERDRALPLPVLVRSQKQLPGIVAALPEAAELLIAAFWPGPLTLVLPAKGGLRWDLGRTDGAVSVRMPLDEVALEVVRAVGPLAVTAANAVAGEPPSTAGDAVAQLGARVAAVLDDGPRPAQLRSTIVDLTRARPQVLREGVVPTSLVLEVAEGRVDPLDAASALDGGSSEGESAQTHEDPTPSPASEPPGEDRPLQGLSRRRRDDGGGSQ